MEDPMSDISKSLKLLKIHKNTYFCGVGGGILLDHYMSLKYGLIFLGTFCKVSENKDLIKRIGHSVAYVKQTLYSLCGKAESLIMKLEHAYADLRDEMKNVIIKPGTNEYDVIFPEIITPIMMPRINLYDDEYDELFPEISNEYDELFPKIFSRSSFFLSEKIKKLTTSDCKAAQSTNMMKELDGIRKMLASLLPIFEYTEAVGRPLTKNKEEKKLSTTVTSVLDKATCLIYMSFVGKIDDEMVFSLKNSLSDLILEETLIMKMYLILDIYSMENLKSHISMSLRLLKWNKKCYLGTEMGGPKLKDHFMSIKHGLQFLVRILELSKDIALKQRIQHFVVIVKHELSILPHNQEVEKFAENLEHAYGELRKKMHNIVIKPGTNDYVMLFPRMLRVDHSFGRTRDFLLEKIIKLVTSSCKAEQIVPMRKELEELRKNLTSLRPFYNDSRNWTENFSIFIALRTFLDRATLLIYLSFIGKLKEDIPLFIKLFSLLIGETDIKEMSISVGILLEDDLESDINISLLLLKRHEEFHIGTINEAMLKDHIINLKHGIEFLRWLPKLYFDRDFKRHIILLAGDVKQKLELITYEQGGESINMDVNGAYAGLREEMKNVIINPATGNYDTFPMRLFVKVYLRSINDFLLEKITSLLTSNWKADQSAPLIKELQDLHKMLTSLRPFCPYFENIKNWMSKGLINFLSVHRKVACLIYLSFLGKMDTEMMLSVTSKISTTIKETDVWEMYKMILNEFLSKGDYVEEELYLLENLISLLKNNVESFNDASSKLYEVLIDIYMFLLGVYPNPNVLLRKRHLLHRSFQDILAHSIPIVCSCYLEDTEQYMSSELNCVLQLIKYIKSESQEIKLYYVPRVDDLGFLEFFSLYLENLLKDQHMAAKEYIGALHFEVNSLLSLAKEVTNKKELNNTPWTDVINMSYQAEYIVDLYLVNSSRELGLISSLSKIIAQLKNIREDVRGLCCKILPAQDVAVTSKPQVFGTSTQVSYNDAIVGLQEDAEIIEYLLKGEKNLHVISIVGMAGIGKTTLALTILKTLSMNHHFDILAWCAVSQSYQNRDLLLAILDQVNSSDTNHRILSEDQELADLLFRSLKKRKYLIVLDDIWDTRLWSYLRRYLPDDSKGSRILITTRNLDVAGQIGSKVNELHELSKEKSWELFQKNILEKESLSADLLRISKGIVEHCKGLPLSIVIIAGILSHIERTKKKWNQIEKSVSSLILTDPQGKCKDILQLSYNHLPNNLRSCFLYLGSFPVVHEISVNNLVCLWIAEGLVQDSESESAEEVAKRYIDDLIVKSLVIPAREGCRGEVKTFRLHDLLHDFCLDKAKEEHFFTLLDERSHSRPLKDPRRLVLNGTDINSRHFSCHSIRSMICYDELKDSEIAKKIGYYDMVLLKVLEVGKVWSDFFPNISSLIHLRYLALGLLNPELSVLPSSVSKLQNLQFLILRCKYYVIKVPDSIFDMVKLRHVHISPGASFEVDSNRLQNSSLLLENLTSLSVARVSFGNSKWLSKLSGLERLHCVFEGAHLKDNQFQMLRFNGHLTCLKVENVAYWKQRFISTCELPTSIRKLTLSRFFLTSNDISEIGRVLPHLEVLKICRCLVPPRYKWNVDDEDFPELKVLKLRSLTISKWTVSEKSFLRLERLWVEKCDYLDEIPVNFGYLSNLYLISVRECAPSVDNSAREIEKMQHEEQNTKMRARIYPRKL